MKISLTYRAIVNGVDSAEYWKLASWKYEEDQLYYYLDDEHIDLGVIGGVIHLISNDSQLFLVVDYWCPTALPDENLKSLKEYTHGQLEDGMGENGFQIPTDNGDVIVKANVESVAIRIEEDGRFVPQPSLLFSAARSGDMNSVQKALLAREPIDIEVQGFTPLHVAILYGHDIIAKLLIDSGSKFNKCDRYGKSPLEFCALSNSLSDSQCALLARSLIGRGADVSIKSPEGWTALDYAINRKKVLLQAELQKGQSL